MKKCLVWYLIPLKVIALVHELFDTPFYVGPAWFKHIYLAKHRTISTITTFVSVRGFERKLQVAYRVHLLNAWYIVIFMADNWHIYENKCLLKHQTELCSIA